MENFGVDSSREMHLESGLTNQAGERKWYAVFTAPQSEKSAVKHLGLREIETFLPTYETVRLWKNRQRVKTILPLFPTYLFVHICSRERAKVLQSPGVLRLWATVEKECRFPIPTSRFSVVA